MQYTQISVSNDGPIAIRGLVGALHSDGGLLLTESAVAAFLEKRPAVFGPEAPGTAS